MEAKLFYEILKNSGFGPFVGVPCSILGPYFILIKTSRVNQDSDKLGRPKELPEEIKQQFIKQILG